MTVDEVTDTLSGLKIEELNPLSPEVIQRQATINIGKINENMDRMAYDCRNDWTCRSWKVYCSQGHLWCPSIEE